ncbi:DUF397 domain-containing protein [Actinoplanes derwentensis]|uniref:DUF397 domain-containing protein n=1 Tax=Actinoplanes derwentensis TaxID=113562 RepID=A0A1H1UYG0_9ACTN|nr:DUF397 domain-containing protein [Actinoplanes derwentensis]GID89801.1 hypothetical protein Ade03nite_87250 [Actinoplanes derwentensis]SDS77493.1 protein of unknown function [Actinoplanes derwentensis]
MNNGKSVSVDWQTSSYCSSSNCVQVAAIEDSIAIRDSKNPDGTVLMVAPGEWHAFLDRVANGDFSSMA